MRSATTAITSTHAGRIELIAAIAAAWLLVLARSWVYLAYPHASFDSDQAVVGLMAKHLSEGRAFPLYLYGYNYMLAVEAWLAVPYFWIAGPTVTALRASIVATNLAVVTLIILGAAGPKGPAYICPKGPASIGPKGPASIGPKGLASIGPKGPASIGPKGPASIGPKGPAYLRSSGLRPIGGLLAATFFALAPPDTTANLIDAGGGNVEPFLWVLLLWMLRRRPIWFGAILGVGVLNREFTIYAVPVLIAGQIWSGAIRTRAAWRRWLISAAAFAVVWTGVMAVRPLADLAGPGTRGRDVGWASSTIDNVAQRIRFDISALPAGVATLISRDVPALAGGRPIETNLARQGHDWVGWLLAVAAIAFVARVSWLLGRHRVPPDRAAMGWYLLGVGLMAVVGYALTRPVDVVTGRYLLLALFVPIGAVAVWLALERSDHVRRAVAAVVITWAVASGADNWRQYARYASREIADPMLEIVAALDARGVAVAKAQYWRAYKLTFLTQERIIVASSDIVRIEAYQRIADAQGDRLVRLERQPCPGGVLVAGLYICD
jgi:hypothetical protein